MLWIQHAAREVTMRKIRGLLHCSWYWFVLLVEPGSTCAVFGVGGVGLPVVMGCKAAGASRIIAIDINNEKLAKAKELGATNCINPQDFNKPVHEVLIEMTGHGVDYSFEVVSLIETMVCNKRCGQMRDCSPGLLPKQLRSQCDGGSAPRGTNDHSGPQAHLHGPHLDRVHLWSWKSKDAVPKLVADYMKKKFVLDPLITHKLPFNKINEAFDLLRTGKSIRSVLVLPDS